MVARRVNRLRGPCVIGVVRVAAETDFDELFREQYPRLAAVALASTGQWDIAQDLAQETMARAHANWDQLAEADVPAAWLRTVLKNLVVDHHRRNASALRARQSMSAPSADAGTLEEVDGASSMLALLEVLPERQRLCVVLRYVDDLGVREIAEVMGVAAGTVKATLWKARRTLERHLRSEESDVVR